MTPTVQDLWSHISNKIANKVVDPYKDLLATIIPIDENGKFCAHITADDKPEYNGDSYDMIRALCFTTELLPTRSFGYMCPALARDPESGEVLMTIISFALVVEHGNVVFGYWNLDTNEVEYMDDEQSKEYAGELPIALSALSLKWELDNGGLGAVGDAMRDALRAAERARDALKKVVEMEKND